MGKKNLILICSGVIALIGILCTIFIFTNNKENKIATYKVTFDSNGGNPIKEQIVNEGEKATKPTDPTKDGYLFVEWLYNNDTFNFAIKIDKDINLIAKWQEVEEEAEMVTVKFETDGGTTISNQIIERGTKITKPESPTKEGYIFKGWYHNEEEFNFDTSITEDIEIKAKWEKEKKEEKPLEKKYTVTFNSNGGSEVKKQEVKKNSKATKPSNPTKEGYMFINWTLDEKEYNFDTKITNNITLVANWLLYGDVNNDNVINGKDTTLLMRYLSGYNVEISKINANMNMDDVLDEIDVSIIRRLSAGEKLKLPYNSGTNYTINYNLNGGSFAKNEYVPQKYAEVTPPIHYAEFSVEKEGYIFIGWTGSNGNVPQKSIEIAEGTTGDLEYNANWLLYGDVNNDNVINGKDTTLLMRYLSGYNVEISKINANMNMDDVLDEIDVSIIRRLSAGEKLKLPYNSGTNYTINYNLNGGSFAKNEYVPQKYAEVTLPIHYAEFSVEKEGYIFIGWTGSNGNVPQKSIEIAEGTTGNLEYNANWLLYGDVNNDNKVDIADSIMIQQYIEGTRELTENQKLTADVNLDDTVNDNDVEIIRNYLAKIIDKLPYTS